MKPLLLLVVLLVSCVHTAWAARPLGGTQVPVIDVRGDKQVCTPNAVLVYTARVTGSCGGPVQWTLDNAIGTLQVLTDSTVRIRFTQPGQAMLRASCGATFNQIQLDYRPMQGAVDLGQDRGICRGDTLQLETGGSFSTVQWSNGSTAPRLAVTRPGTYHVAVSNDGQCFQRDTVQITALNMPSADLPADTVLCLPGTLELQASNRYISYLWQDGSTRSYFTVSRPGTYWVRVTNSFGCTDTDTTVISETANKPANFALFSDTAICAGELVTLRVNGSFVKYNWNFGLASTPQLQVNKPGNYTIEVYTPQGCSGFDTIYVADEGCNSGIFVPNAFTPNNDGQNDQLRARVYGELDVFVLEVYNRWGAMVFRSNNPANGWSGLYQGRPQPADTYVWQLQYRLPGGGTQYRRGTLVLLR